jgi:hypothetical protein
MADPTLPIVTGMADRLSERAHILKTSALLRSVMAASCAFAAARAIITLFRTSILRRFAAHFRRM